MCRAVSADPRADEMDPPWLAVDVRPSLGKNNPEPSVVKVGATVAVLLLSSGCCCGCCCCCRALLKRFCSLNSERRCEVLPDLFHSNTDADDGTGEGCSLRVIETMGCDPSPLMSTSVGVLRRVVPVCDSKPELCDDVRDMCVS